MDPHYFLAIIIINTQQQHIRHAEPPMVDHCFHGHSRYCSTSLPGNSNGSSFQHAAGKLEGTGPAGEGAGAGELIYSL